MSAIFTELEECPNCGCKLIQFDGEHAMCPSCTHAELAAAQRTIEARENSVLEIWQDWIEANARADEMQVYYIEEKSRHAAGARAAQQDEARLTRERDEAQKANKAYTVLIALDRDEIAELNRRIAELEQSEAHLNEEIEATSELWALVDHARLGLSE